ncbi:MAG: NfeD family protein [Bacteroidales bacterium]|jgi:membrane protein implicated in regulation of membrane protease activity|nr:NfeD family protein [Bacteroidales bacterium]
MEINALFWLLCGIAGFLLELAAPGFVLFFFGIGALVTAALAYFFDISTTAQLIVFVVISCASLAAFRRTFKQLLFNRKHKTEDDELHNEFIGKTAVVIENFEDFQGRVELNGSTWKATGGENFKKGDVIIIQKRENLTLIVTKPKEEQS